MSQENLDLVRSIYAALEHGDRAPAELIDPDFEWIPDESHTLAQGPIRGRENVERYFEDLAEMLQPHVKLEEAVEKGDQVMAFVHVRGRGQESGVELDVRTAHLWTFRSGRAVRSEVYADRRKALEAVGLSEQDAHADS